MLAGVGDPGDEHVVRVVDEVVSREGVDELAITLMVCDGDGDELTVARSRRAPFGPDEEAVSVRCEQRRRDEDQWIVACVRRLDDRRDRRVIACYETSE